MAAVRDALEIARETRTSDDIGRAWVNLVESLYDCGFGGETIEAAAEGIRVSDELGMEHSYGHYIRLNGAASAYAIGRWDLAGTWAEEAIDPRADRLGCRALPVRQHAGPVRRGRQLRRRRRRPRQGLRALLDATLGCPVHRPHPRCRGGTRAVAPSTAWKRWRWPNAGSTGWPRPRTGSRRCVSAASPSGRPRTWAKRLGRRATPPGSRTHGSVSPAWPRGWTSSRLASRAPAVVASWPPTG